MTTSFEKEKLRKELKHQRQLFVKTAALPLALSDLYQNFLSLNLLSSPRIIGGYWAIGSEVPLLPLLEQLHEKGHTIVLPCIAEPNQFMVFKKWVPACEMAPDACGIPAPVSEENILPEMLLVPLLGFDERGARLGQGKGYYDAFIQQIKAMQSLQTVGIAYEIQKISNIPLESHDQHLNYVVTENRIYSLRC